ncbi:hypothetical protein AQ505_02005 [Pedobacter sp. PACM 27299]|uniref:hypothetical protein n=1 Tax=Pedobacter sp. PACM 27299 TaxID=1727164 RepID=UPI000706BC17|nr:hypothetical protein [Pedobacter sp. PACM 27299]ALL04378.1 hypothetical protein AQ505_02005 [Pedobacter sp. PACM 27299]
MIASKNTLVRNKFISCPPCPPKKTMTARQIAHRNKLRAVTASLKIRKSGQENNMENKGIQTEAVEINPPRFFSDLDSNRKMNFEDVQLVDGCSAKLENLQLEDKGAGLFGLSWDGYDHPLCRYHNVALVLFEEVRQQFFYELEFSNTWDRKAEFRLDMLAGSKVHVHVFTVRLKWGRKTSNSPSQYLGVIV